jgi:polyisoprenoid-binding protein YceI
MLSQSLKAQQYKPLDDSSSIAFKIKNFGIAISGTVTGLKGAVTFDPKNLSGCAFQVTAETATVNTGIEMRDGHLKKEEYLSATEFPTLSFVSTKVTPSTKPDYLFLFGNLTIKGVTKAISFPFQAVPNGDGYTFTGSFSINRRDYTVGGASLSMSDNIDVTLKVVALPIALR